MDVGPGPSRPRVGGRGRSLSGTCPRARSLSIKEGIWAYEEKKIYQSGTPDLLWLGPQGAADRGRLRRFTAAPCPFGKHIAVHHLREQTGA